MHSRRKRGGYEALNTIPSLFAHRFAKREATIIIANYYTCSSQTGHSQLDLGDRIRALARGAALACEPNADQTTGLPVAAAGRDRGFCILVQAVPVFEAHTEQNTL